VSKWVAVVVGAALVVGLVSVGSLGHRAAAVGGTHDDPASAVQLSDADLSQVVYGELLAAHPSLWVTVDVPTATDLSLQLGIPALDRLRTYRLQWVVLGPELPLIALPISVPSGLGGMLVLTSSVDDATVFHEPVTDTTSWVLGEATVHLPASGRYYIVAWSPSIMDGKAWIAVGRREAFGWKDLTSLRQVIDEVRAFHEAGPDPRFLMASKALYLAGIALLIACLAFL
jgi:hypothetical protein